MKKFITKILFLATIFGGPLFAGVIKESQAKREVDDAIQALAAMDARQDLSTFIPQREAYSARTFCNKARNFMSDSEYDKASFYAVLSTNFSKISVARGLLAKAEKDKLEQSVIAMKINTVVPRLKSAGLKRKGSSGVFSGKYTLKTLYATRRKPKVDAIPAITSDMVARVGDMVSVLKEQKDVKVIILARSRNEELAGKYASSISDALIEKGIEVARIETNTKKGRDGVEVTLTGVTSK
jgi:hypothetical protein